MVSEPRNSGAATPPPAILIRNGFFSTRLSGNMAVAGEVHNSQSLYRVSATTETDDNVNPKANPTNPMQIHFFAITPPVFICLNFPMSRSSHNAALIDNHCAHEFGDGKG